MSRFDCLCAGIVVADFICAPVASMPAAGGLAMTDGIALSIGGCASNVAVDLARLGRRVAVAGRIGEDAPGRFVRESLAAARVDTSLLIDTRQLPTSGTLVINVCGEDRRFIHAVGANAEYTGADLTAEVIESARVSYLGGFCLMPGLSGDCARRLFRTARQGGAITVLDVAIPDSRDWWPELRKVLPWTDVFLPNMDEARQLTGLDDPRRQAERFAAAGAGAVVITCGSEGAVLLDSRSRHSARAFAVECVDGTGSGDAFAAGYIDGLLQGLPAIRCLEIGSALGASCVRQPGATTGVFDRAELDRFLAQRRLEIETWT